MPGGEDRLSSITLIRVSLGTERERYRGVMWWRRHGRAEIEEQRTDDTDEGRLLGRCVMNSKRPTEKRELTNNLCPPLYLCNNMVIKAVNFNAALLTTD